MTDKRVLIAVSLIGLILGFVLLVFSQGRYTTAAQSYRFYKYGVALAQDKDYQNAYYNFGRIGKNAKVYPLAVYKQAICARELNDTKTAIRKFKHYIKIIKDESLEPVGYWELGELYYNNGNFSAASKYYKQLQKKYPKSDFAYAANYRLGELWQEKTPEASKELFLGYIKHAPKGRFSLNAIERLDIQDLNSEEKIIVANSMYENEKFGAVVEILTPVQNEKKWYLLGKTYVKTDKKDLAREAFLKTLQTMKEDKGEQINNTISNFAAVSGTTKLQAYEKLLKEVKNPITLAGIYFNQAQAMPRATAITSYQKAYKENPEGFFAPESLWEIFFDLYSKGQSKEALKVAQEHNTKFPNANSTPKVLYFAGKIHLRVGDKVQAEKFFKKVFDTFPDSYYAYRSNEKLNREQEQFKTIKGINLPDQAAILPLPIQSKYLSELLMLRDFETIESFKIQDEFLKSWLAKVKESNSYSITLARNAMAKIENKPEADDVKWKLIYPIYWSKTINLMAENSNVSPHMIIAIMKEESAFDPMAKSSVGALGLMQIMPDTGKFVDPDSYSTFKLYEPFYNMYLGSKYYRMLIRQFGGNEMFALASYNGGAGNVIKWKEDFFTGDCDDFVEKIPFPETRSYVKKVFASYWNYLRIYGKS